MSPLPLFNSFKQRGVAFFILLFVFTVFTYLEFDNYKSIIKEEIYQTDATIKNIYEKNKYNVLKLQTDNFTFFTSVSKTTKLKKLQKINLFFLTKNISFTDYLKGFYTHSFSLKPYPKENSFKSNLYDFIDKQHQNKSIASLYSALFLAISVDDQIREFTAIYGISHLIAISGFHLGVLSIVIYFLLHLLYNPIHKKYFPYRNKRFDILVLSSIILFCYLVLLDFVPSLLRAFTMLIFGLYLIRNNIKILSFETLFWIVLIILALFPKLLFSLSLWFSVAGVFYIFLFLHYFKALNKYIQLLLFNLWIYLAMNPIVHYFFDITSYEQLLSPIITIIFTLFYPFVFILHLFTLGDLLDPFLEYILNIDINVFERGVDFPLFISYVLLSLVSIYSKKGFYLLNFFILAFSIYLFI